MTWKFVCAVALGTALLSATPARAASCKKDSDCGSGQVCSNGTCVRRASRAASDAARSVAPTDDSMAGTKRTSTLAWAGLGLYEIGSAYFGLHAGAATNLYNITPELPLIGWADVALGFASGDVFFPIAVGPGVRYDKAGPLQLIGGLGFAFVPHSGGGTTPIGLRIMGMALYPLPQIHRNLSAQAQLSYDILTESSHVFAFTVGAGYAL